MALYWWSRSSNALAASTAETVIELAAGSNDPIKIKEWWVNFDGTSSTEAPVLVEVGRFSAGVTTGSTRTAEKFDTGTGGGTTAVTVKDNVSTEGAGTADDIQFFWVPPTSGFHYIAPLGQEVIIAGSGFWRIRCTAAATRNVIAGVVWDD